MSSIAIIFHFTKSHLNAEIFQDIEQTQHMNTSAALEIHLWTTVLAFPENKLHGWIFYKGLHGMRELCSENEEEFEKLKGPDSALGREQKVILLECNLFLSCIFVEWTYSVLNCIQAVNCRVPAGNTSYALDYNKSSTPPRQHEYALAAGKRAS